jgi:hypothetical protein
MNTRKNTGFGDAILKQAANSIDAYESYLAHLHYCDYPESLPESTSKTLPYRNLSAQTPERFAHLLRDRLSFTLKTTLSATGRPLSLLAAERQRETIPSVQLYLTNIVGHVALQRVMAEGWSATNPHLQQLRNPFENDETLMAVWKYANDRRFKIGLDSLGVLAPGYYDELE